MLYALSIAGALFHYMGMWGRKNEQAPMALLLRTQIKDPDACAHAGTISGLRNFQRPNASMAWPHDFGPNRERVDSLPAFGDQALTV
jgi:hypothetical protein